MTVHDNNIISFATFTVGLVLCCALSLTFSRRCLANESSGSIDAANGLADSSRVVRSKLRSEEPWESAVNFPGRLVFFPVKLTLLGVQETANLIERTKFLPRLIESLKAYKPRGVTGKYSSRHGAGLSYYIDLDRQAGKRVDITGQWGLRDRHRYRSRVLGFKPFGEKIKTDFIAYHQYLSNESFFGIGNDTPDTKTSYGLRQTTVETALKYSIRRKMWIGARLVIDINEVMKGRSDHPDAVTVTEYQDNTVPGLHDDSRILRLEIDFHHNFINRFYRPTAGGILDLSGGIFADVSGSDFRFMKMAGSYEHYIHLFHTRTLRLRVVGKVIEPFDNKMAPFYYMTELGLEETVRGYTRGRYRNEDAFITSLDYTYPVWRKSLDAGLFVDAGQVAEDIFDRFSIDRFHYGYGAFMNIWAGDHVMATGTVAFSDERVRFYFTLNRDL